MVTRRKLSGSANTQGQFEDGSTHDDVPMCNVPTFLRRNLHRAIQLHKEELENRRPSTQDVGHLNHRLRGDSELCRPDDIVNYYRDTGTFQVHVKTIQRLKKDVSPRPQASRPQAGKPLLFYGKLDIQLEILQIGSELDTVEKPIVSITHKATIRGTSPFAGNPAVINAPPFVVKEGDFQLPFIRLDGNHQYTLRISLHFEDSSTAEEIRQAVRESGTPPTGVSNWRACYADILRCPKDSIILPLHTNLELSNGKGNVEISQDEHSLGLEVLMGYTGYARPGASSPLALANQTRKSLGLARHGDTVIRFKNPEKVPLNPGPSCQYCGAKCFDFNTLQVHLRLSHGHSGSRFSKREAVNGVSSRDTVGNELRQGSCKDEVFVILAPPRPFNLHSYLEDGDDSWLRDAVQFSSSKSAIAIHKSENTTRGATQDLGAVTSDSNISSITTLRSGQRAELMPMDEDEDCPAPMDRAGRVNRTGEGTDVEMKDATDVPSPEPSPLRTASSLNSPGIRPSDPPCQPSAETNHSKSPPRENTTTVTLPLDQLSIAEATDIDTVTHSQTPTAATAPSQQQPSSAAPRPAPLPQKQHLCAHPHHHLTVPHTSTTFFHPLTSRPLVPGEPVPCPESYDDMEMVDLQMIANIQHNPRLNSNQKAFLTLYNPFMRRERVGGYVHLGAAMVRLARHLVDRGVFGSDDGCGDEEEGAERPGDGVWSEFRKLLGGFQGAGFFGEEVVRECEGIVLAAMRGREGRRKGRMEMKAKTKDDKLN